ncbi:hypothetical protein PZ78_01470 [Vreelandella venusta]|nr:hypothetical protein PZ78_01470 [Halomonas hydrothermalis]
MIIVIDCLTIFFFTRCCSNDSDAFFKNQLLIFFINFIAQLEVFQLLLYVRKHSRSQLLIR